jgi:histone H3/H4
MVRKIDPNMKISDDAKREIRNMAERFAMEVLRGAVEIAVTAKRKTVLREDLRVAKKQLLKVI